MTFFFTRFRIANMLYCILYKIYFWKSKSSLKTPRVLSPYKAWKPQLVLASHLWHSPCRRQHTSARLHQWPVECHSMWKHPEHLIITLIEPAPQIWGRHGLSLAYLRLQQHHVWLAPVHTRWTFRHNQTPATQPWLWWWCAGLSSEAGLKKPSTLWRFTGTNQWSIECLGVFGVFAMVAQHVRVTLARLLNLDSHKVILYGCSSTVWHFDF